jgi:hypothetical protein
MRRILTGILALLFTGGVIGGAPVLLYRVAGNPLPKHVPTLDEITQLLLAPDDGSLFLKVLALVGWLAWATFTLGVLVELQARLRGRRARRVPGLGVQQKVAGALVGSIIAVFVGASVAHASTVPGQAQVAIVAAAPSGFAAAPLRILPGPLPVTMPQQAQAQQAQAQQAQAQAQPHAQAQAQAQAQQAQQQEMVYVVNRGDYLGRIAERFTGNFDCYRDLMKLNGQLIRNPNHIEPGWRIKLPADARDRGIMSHATGRLATPESPQATVPAPPAPKPEEKPPAQQEPAPQTPAPQTPAAQTPAPQTPATQTPAPETPATQTPAPQTPAPQAPSQRPASQTQTEASQEPDDSGDKSLHTPLAAGAGIAAASVLAAHVIIRRRQLKQTKVRRQRRRRVTTVFLPTVETARQQMAKHRAVDRIDATLRALAISLRDRPYEQLPDIAAVWQSDGDLAVILATACPEPPEPFEERWQNTWALPAPVELPESSWAPPLLPALMTFATWPQGGELLVDGERTGLLTITGDPLGSENLLRCLAAEAATSPWADGLSVLVAGMSPADTHNLSILGPSRVRTAPSVPEALGRIAKRAAANASILRETDTPDTMAARVTNLTDGFWATHVLFVADPWGEHTQQLRELDHQLSGLKRVGVAVVATHPTATRWSATVSTDSSLHMAWLAVAGANARQLTAEQLAAQVR